MGYDPNKIDPSILNKPAIEVLATKLGEGDQGVPVKVPEGFMTEEKTEAAVEEPTPEAALESEEESKVPYSRFKKFHDAAKEAQEQAEYWRQQAEQLRTPQQPYAVPHSTVDPRFEGTDWERFKTLYAGADEELVKSAYKLELERLQGIEERATQRALESLEQRRTSEQESINQNIAALDENLEIASDILGRQLSEEEQYQLLEIQDEYSPKDKNGNIEALIPIEKALEIYQLQNQRSPKREARNQVAALSAPSAHAETTTETKDTGWQRGAGWRANFERRFGKKA